MSLAALFVALASVVHTVARLATYVLLARIVLSWVRPNPSARWAQQAIGAVYAVTDPVLDGAQRAFPFLRMGGLDLSPIAVFFALGLVEQLVTGGLIQVATSLG